MNFLKNLTFFQFDMEIDQLEPSFEFPVIKRIKTTDSSDVDWNKMAFDFLFEQQKLELSSNLFFKKIIETAKSATGNSNTALTSEYLSEIAFGETMSKWNANLRSFDYLPILCVSMTVIDSTNYFVCMSLTSSLQFIYESGTNEISINDPECSTKMISLIDQTVKKLQSRDQKILFLLVNDENFSIDVTDKEYELYYCGKNLLNNLMSIDLQSMTNSLSSKDMTLEAKNFTNTINVITILRDQYARKYLPLAEFTELLLDVVVNDIQKLKCPDSFFMHLDQYFKGFVLASNVLHPKFYGKKISITNSSSQYASRARTYCAANLDHEGANLLSDYFLKAGIFSRLFDDDGRIMPAKSFYDKFQLFYNPKFNTFCKTLINIPAFMPDLEMKEIFGPTEALAPIVGDDKMKIKYFRTLKVLKCTANFCEKN